MKRSPPPALKARTPSRPLARALYAAGLLVAALAALLVAWFISGWADVRAQQREVRAEPSRAAEQRGVTLAHELRAELGRLMAREFDRKYYEYQNLMHDDRLGDTWSVTPSPLSSGSQDPFVLGYFQIDSAGRTTTPTINDELPNLSEPKRLAEHQRFRDEVTRNFASLAPPAKPALVAEATPKPKPQPQRVLVNEPETDNVPEVHPTAPVDAGVGSGSAKDTRTEVAQITPQQQQQQQQQQQNTDNNLNRSQVLQIDPSSYAQNNYPNTVYWGNNPGNRNVPQQQRVVPQQRNQRANPPAQANPSQQAANPPPQQPPQINQPLTNIEQAHGNDEQAAPPPKREPLKQVFEPLKKQADARAPAQPPATGVKKPKPKPRYVYVAPPPEPPPPPKAITVNILPLEWHTLQFAGQPTLVAVRRVEKPEETLAQGFVVDRTQLTSWLASRAGDAVAELRTGDAASTAEIVPGWHLEVAANPRALVQAAVDAEAVARGFVLRFIAVGVIAMLAAAFVVLLVARAEKLARERSQFAAAAAHELRTPLAGLQLYGDMLADGLGDPGKIRDYARRMSEEASRLGRVVSNVLGFSQLERGNLSVEAKPGELGTALCELADRAQPALDRAGAALELDVPPDLRAQFDRDALARIVGNLLDNAEKYSRESDDRTIGLAARELETCVEIVVSDHGPGITQQTRTRLFRPFSRGVSGDGPAGLGLGLALSQSLARAMKGDLDYRPLPGGGASFVLRLDKA